MSTQVKICGITTAEALQAAIDAGADYIGLMHCGSSPRYISLEEAAVYNATAQAAGVKTAAVVQNPTDEFLAELLYTPDYIQLHGDESPARVAEIKAQTGCGIIKALKAADADKHDEYEAADILLFDAASPGSGEVFDWNLLNKLTINKPWMLAGGLHAGNVQEAIKQTGAPIIDVSSGVEREKGVKDPDKIREFIQIVR